MSLSPLGSPILGPGKRCRGDLNPVIVMLGDLGCQCCWGQGSAGRRRFNKRGNLALSVHARLEIISI